MKYIIDSSVTFKWAVNELDSERARRLRDDFIAGIHEFVAPDILPVELAHALTRAERQKRIQVGEAMILWSDALSTPPQFILHRPLLSRAIEISSQERVGVYDCVYVALAELENCEFVTADDKFVNNVQARFPFVISLSTLP